VASVYDTVVVVVRDTFIDTIRDIYKYNTRIQFHVVSHDREISLSVGCPIDVFRRITEGHDVYLAGMHKKNHTSFTNFPLCFYDDLNIPRSIFWSHSNVDKSTDNIALFDTIKLYKYIFMANKCSFGSLFDPLAILSKLNINIDDYLIVNTHSNIYPESHKFYSIAQNFLEYRPLTQYISVIENADSLILTDSSIFCFCHLLNIKSTNNYVITRSIDLSHIYNKELFEEGTPIRVKFQCINI
jgi:hypothetical protein